MTDLTDMQAQTADLGSQLSSLTKLSDSFGNSLANALGKAGDGGKKLDDVLRNVGTRLAELLAKSAMQPLQGFLSTLAGSFGSALGGGGGPGLQAFADGGVLGGPTLFPMAGGLGLAGEAGPEAIMPLARGPDGRLGVRAGAGGGRPVQVTVQVKTPDAESFRRSQAQIGAALARAVAKGQRAL